MKPRCSQCGKEMKFQGTQFIKTGSFEIAQDVYKCVNGCTEYREELYCVDKEEDK